MNKINTYKNIISLLKTKYAKAVYVSALYSLFVFWIGNYWLFFGLIIISDLMITRFVNWRFWRKRKPKGEKYRFSTQFIDSLIIAVFLACFVRVFFLEAFAIPTSSMEKTLEIDEYIFVGKLRYGPRLPITPLSFPFSHNTLPFTKNIKTFFSWIQLPFKQLQGFSHIKNYDVVVFNYPEGDTVIKSLPNKSYYQMVRQFGANYIRRNYELSYRPIDKRDNYIKRVIGIPGDTIQIIHGRAFINNIPEPGSKGIQFNYSIKAKGCANDTAVFRKLGVSLYDITYNPYNNIYSVPLTSTMYDMLKDSGYYKAVVRIQNTDPSSVNNQIFPFDRNYSWTEDNYGPVVIPSQGITVKLDLKNISLYERIITAYEGNVLSIRSGMIYINDCITDSYTLKMNYYYMLGDNRHNSNDSRFWGFVPENHIIGKATLVWLSIDKNKKNFSGIRWNKMFKFIR